MRKQTWKAAVSAAAIAAGAAIPMAANADIVTNEVDGVKWALNINTSAKTACLGAYTAGVMVVQAITTLRIVPSKSTLIQGGWSYPNIS